MKYPTLFSGLCNVSLDEKKIAIIIHVDDCDLFRSTLETAKEFTQSRLQHQYVSAILDMLPPPSPIVKTSE